ncbi:transcriptional regulator of pyridoxine metabolism [Bacillus sp. JCM 19046]|nr:transcriptional regulator of pyridoxine metabolism [Bacillus sp. JCM 19046]
MDTIWCALKRDSTIPLYEQLYTHLKAEITSGRIAYGTKLPSKRKLAAFLKVSQNTIEATYEQLTAEGYVEVKPRKGFFVQAYEELEQIPSKKSPELQSTSPKKQIRFNFHPTHIDTAHFPFNKWRKYMKQAIDQSNRDLLLLGNQQGEEIFRSEIAHYLYHSRGVQCTPEQIVVGAGMETLLQQLFLLFGETTIYGIEDPGYQLIKKILRHYPNHYEAFPVDHEGVNVDALSQSQINIMYLTPSHHFPYGSVLSINRRKRLLNWAESDSSRFIIEDDYDSEFRYSGKTIPSLQSMDQHGKVVYLGSFSKSLIPSARISYMVLPKPLLTSYQQMFSSHHSTVARFDQVALAEFMKHGDFEKHLNRMRKLYRRKLDRVLSLLKPFEEELTIIGDQSGLHIVLVVNNGMDEETLVTSAALLTFLSIHSRFIQLRQEPINHLGLFLALRALPRLTLNKHLHPYFKHGD